MQKIIVYLVVQLLSWSLATHSRSHLRARMHHRSSLKEKRSENLFWRISHDSNQELTIRLSNPDFPFMEMPHRFPFPFSKPASAEHPDYSVETTQNGLFALKVTRKSTQEVLLDTSRCGMVFRKNQIAFCTVLPTRYLFGLGSRRSKFLYEFPKKPSDPPRAQSVPPHYETAPKSRKVPSAQLFNTYDSVPFDPRIEKVYSIWPRDAQDAIDEGQGGQQTHGHHPVYLSREKSNKFHIVLIRNLYPIEFRLRTTQDKRQLVDFLLLKGPLELKIFLGDSPEEVTRLYHQYLNGYALPQFWTMGYQQSRYGFRSVAEISRKVEIMRNAEIPVDVVWVDIDHLDQCRSFTFDRRLFGQQNIVSMAKRLQVKWIPIQDDFIEIAQDYLPFDLGRALDVFYKERSTGTYVRGCGYVGETVFPSYASPKALQYVQSVMKDYFLNQLTDYSVLGGIWLDLNEPANFKEIRQDDENADLSCWTTPPNSFDQARLLEELSSQSDSELERVQQQVPVLESESLPRVATEKARLEFKTIRLDSYSAYDQSLLDESVQTGRDYLSHLDTHVLNAFLQNFMFQLSMQPFLGEDGQTPFLLTRANTLGMGRFSQHWLGDTGSTAHHLRLSTSQLFQSQLFGLPLTGDDVCGFMRETTPGLCARWTQLGSVYPFMRNHNIKESPDQDPTAFLDHPEHFQSIRNSIQFRYSIAKWYYGVIVSKNGAGGVFLPLFYQYPRDDQAYEREDQFLIGEELMFVNNPDDEDTVEVYNPTHDQICALNSGRCYKDIVMDVPNPLPDSLLGFLLAGKSINFQPFSSAVINTYSLDSTFWFYAHVTPLSQQLYHAQGQMLSIADYSTAHSRCQGHQNCLLTYSLLVNTDQALNVVSVEVTLEGPTPDALFLAGLRIYGLNPERFNDIPLDKRQLQVGKQQITL